MNDVSPEPGGVLSDEDDDLRRDTDQVVRLHGEVLRRLSFHGFRDIGELVAMHEQVRAAAQVIASQEIDGALVQIGSVLDRLRLIGKRLAALAEIRRSLFGDDPDDRV
jgi:hypothetical protein